MLWRYGCVFKVGKHGQEGKLFEGSISSLSFTSIRRSVIVIFINLFVGALKK